MAGFKNGNPGCCCGSWTLVVGATKCPGPAGTPYPGVAVVVKQGSTTIGTGTTAGTPATTSFVLPAAGTYTVTATDPNGIVQTQTVVVSSTGTTSVGFYFITAITVIVHDYCTNAGLSGATVSIPGVGSGTTSGGSITFNLTTAVSGTLTATCVYLGRSVSQNFTATCQAPPFGFVTSLCTQPLLADCNSRPVKNATVAWSTAYGSLGSSTTAEDGSSCITPAFGVYYTDAVTASITKTRFNPAATSGVASACANLATPVFTAASGYVCTSCCVDPLKTTLHYSDPLGSGTLVYDSALGVWITCDPRGPFTVSSASGGCGFSSVTDNVNVKFFFSPSCQFGVAPDSCTTGGIVVLRNGPCSGIALLGAFSGSVAGCPEDSAFVWSAFVTFPFNDARRLLYGSGFKSFQVTE